MKRRQFSLSVLMLLFAIIFMAAGGHVLAADDFGDDIRAYRQTHATRILSTFREFVSIPNVSARRGDIARNAQWIQEALTQRGVKAEIWTVAGANPVVYGELPADGAEKTVVFYAHFDGQPVDETKWLHPPFVPTLVDGDLASGGQVVAFPQAGEVFDAETTRHWRMYGRGTSDDRAAVMAMLAALDAMQATGHSPGVNIKFFFDGEEEIGSPNMRAYLSEYESQLSDADLWLFCDGPVHQTRKPQLVFGVRGIVQFELTIYGANRPLHSGHYGNWAPNPALEMAKLLGSMKDDDGRVLVEGFYDSIDPLGGRELTAIADLPEVDEALLSELDLSAPESATRNYYQSLMFPSLNIRGMQSATVGETARNIVPHEATATLDIRLVKGNDPGEMLRLVRNHIEQQGYHIVFDDPTPDERRQHGKLVRFRSGGGMPASRTPMGLPLVQDVIAAAELASDEELLLVPTLGGTLPIARITETSDVPVIIVPIANHDNNQHAPNENIRLANLWYGVELMARLMAMK